MKLIYIMKGLNISKPAQRQISNRYMCILYLSFRASQVYNI